MLFIASVVFLGSCSWVLGLALVVSSLSAWWFGKQISVVTPAENIRIHNSSELATNADDPQSLTIPEKSAQKGSAAKKFLYFGVGVNLFILVSAKMGSLIGIEGIFDDFTNTNDLSLTNSEGWLVFGVLFFTLQSIGYLIDVYRGELSGKQKAIDVMLLVSWFPKLPVGPLVSNEEFLRKLKETGVKSEINATKAFYLIAKGGTKKYIFANFLAVSFVDQVYGNPGIYSSIDILLLFPAFFLQFYWNLSGLFDIASGLSLLLGYELPMNFNSPFRSTSLFDFVKRFNLSFTEWMNRYVFRTLKTGKFEKNALFASVLIGGLWYGAGINSLLLGLFAVATVYFLQRKGKLSSAVPGGLTEISSSDVAGGLSGVSSGEAADGFSGNSSEAVHPDLFEAVKTETSVKLSEPVLTKSETQTKLKKVLNIVSTLSLVSLLLVFIRGVDPVNMAEIFATLLSFDFTSVSAGALTLTVIFWGFAIQYIEIGEFAGIISPFFRLHPLSQAMIIGVILLAVSIFSLSLPPALTYFSF
ncbi:MAG: hypothetical protein LC102_02445 [Ignavibacteriales bacterium]|nr:hypothetical protein [Ignavibacteria bacterium]MBZ0197316.1 hypothetical protein [Ignavibacteriaceae bacterium]MCZ2142273.1 hypothetical protein [Ignavibacteriales bacterium]WKZ73435.1 MAG: MBOAT family O-acyltransferase [Ignavibacteriaceae bacterium]